MAHELEMVDGKASMAYAGDVPWHGLGKKVHNDLTPNQMLVEAGLNWTVDKVPLFADIDGKQVKSGAEALVRSSDKKIMSIVTDSWNPCQNEEAFKFFNDFVYKGDMEMHTAGALMGGKHVWALAKIKESFNIFGGDQVDGYLLFSNPHIFGKSIDVRFTPIRVVCNNTLTLSLNTKSNKAVKVSHRREFDPEMVKEMLGIASIKLDKYKDMAEFLGSKRYTTENVIEYFNQVFPKSSVKDTNDTGQLASRTAKLAFDLLNNQPGAKFAEGTWWSAINSVTYATDHLIGRNPDTRLTSAWFGSGQKNKVEALNLAMDYASAA